MSLVMVTGSRDFNDYQLMRRAFNEIYKSYKLDNPVLIHGAARGADRMAHTLWRSAGFNIIEVPADWNTHGSKAGMIRNDLMLDYNPLVVVAFPLSDSIGTYHAMNSARERSIPVETYYSNSLKD